jgi:hypothetical protein
MRSNTKLSIFVPKDAGWVSHQPNKKHQRNRVSQLNKCTVSFVFLIVSYDTCNFAAHSHELEYCPTFLFNFLAKYITWFLVVTIREGIKLRLYLQVWRGRKGWVLEEKEWTGRRNRGNWEERDFGGLLFFLTQNFPHLGTQKLHWRRIFKDLYDFFKN